MNQEDVPSVEEDLEYLREAGLVEIVGINDNGDWLYGLSPKAKEVMDLPLSSDELIKEMYKLVDEVENGRADTPPETPFSE